jgi:hypothetical protein
MKKSLFVLACLASLASRAQDEITTERPNETLSPETVSKNIFQTEIGFRKTRDNAQDKVWQNPDVLLRYGLLNRLELRLESTVENQKLFSEGKFRNGLRPLELGLKVNFFETKNEAFTSAIVGQVGIPTFATSAHKTDRAYHRVRLLFENKISDKFKLNYNVGSEWDSQEQEQNWVYTFAPELDITDRWETFIEVFGFAKKGKSPEEIVDAGFAYLLSKNTKVDVSGGVGLNSESPHYFVAAGFSFRVGGKKHSHAAL